MKNISFLFLLQLLMTRCISQNGLKPLDADLTGYEYPFPVHYFPVEVQGQSLHMAYMDIAPTSLPRATVILLHGKNFCGAYWDRTALDLSKHGFRVIIPDQIGFGKSSKPDHLQYSFQLLALLTNQLLDSLRIQKIVVIGHSMGGMLAIRFALMFPGKTEKLILEDPLGLEDWKLKVPYQKIEQWYDQEVRQDFEKIKKYQQDNYYAGEWKAEYERWVSLLAGWRLGPDKKRIAWNSALTYDMIFTQPVIYDLEKITIPTLLIIGQNDKTALGKNLVTDSVKKTMGNYPLLAKQATARLRECTLTELKDIGHLPHIQAYDLFINPVINFLKK